MKKTTIMLAALVALLVVATTGCDLLFGEKVTDLERVNGFISSLNASPRNYDALQGHWHSTAPSFSSMNTQTFWEDTSPFPASEQGFQLSSLTEGGEVNGIPGTSSLSGTITTASVTDRPIIFGLVADETNPRNKKIRVITLGDPVDDTLQNIR